VADVGGLPFLKVRRSGYGMIYGKAQCDFPPIELGYLAGVAVALKMEFTDDVGDLEAAADGGWHTLGELRIGGKGAVVLDANKSDAAWRQDVDLPAGWYLAQTYQWGDDHLGIRLLARDTDLA
jgi:hypothetical protein